MVLPFIICFSVFTASSVRPLDWGYATEDCLNFTHHVLMNCWNRFEEKGRPPPLLSSSGVPCVWNSSLQIDINFKVVALTCFLVVQNNQADMSICKVYSGSNIEEIHYYLFKGSIWSWYYLWPVCLGPMFVHAKQLALNLYEDAFILGQYIESLVSAFMLTMPWWAECKQYNIFPMRDLGMAILSSIRSKPLSVLSQWYISQKLWISSLEKNPCLGVFIRVV